MSAAPTLAPVTPFGQAAEHLKVKLRAGPGGPAPVL